jgi:hypothetical protein
MEFEQLVYNAPAILRPRRFAVLGEHAILQQLREFAGHEPLAKDAERLFARGALPDGTYVARNGRWLPEMRPEALIPEPEAPDPARELERLAGPKVDALSDRLESLEQMVHNLQRSLEGILGTINDLAAQPPAASSAPRAAQPQAAPQPRAAVPSKPPRGPAEPMGGPAMVDSIPPVVPVPQPLDPSDKPITLPTLSALSDKVKSLAGPDASLQQAERADWLRLAEAGPVYLASIQKHDSSEVGAMILDIESALRLAGALLMESEEMVTSLLEEKMMSDEMLDAASEVCNTLMSAFNKVSGNPHLRVTKLVPFETVELGWLASARKIDDYRYSLGGRLAMVMR